MFPVDGLNRSMAVRVAQRRTTLFTDTGRPTRSKAVRGVGDPLPPVGS